MEFTEVNITITYHKYDKDYVDEVEETKWDHHTLMIQEGEKSYFNPQEKSVSKDMRKALDVFCQNLAAKYGYLGFRPSEDYWINHIDGSGNDVNL